MTTKLLQKLPGNKNVAKMVIDFHVQDGILEMRLICGHVATKNYRHHVPSTTICPTCTKESVKWMPTDSTI